MDCPECVRLTAAHEALQKLYLTAFSSMLEASGGPPDEFVKFRTAYDEARFDAESARLELQHHKRRHSSAT
jgi:hypothetical protein